jgi:uncharacterized membrane protein YfcA
MSDIVTFIGIFLIGVAASVIGTLVGGGSLLSIGFLIFIGLPPQVAIATDRFGSLGQAIAAFFTFHQSKKIIWKYVVLLSLLSLIGSLIGANILLQIDAVILKNVVGVLMLLLLPIFFLQKDIGTERRKAHLISIIIGAGLYLLVQILTGFLGGGTGTLIFYILMLCFGLTIIEVSATQLIPVFILNISSVIIFASHGIIDYKMGIVLLAGMALGGYLGAHLALQKGELWVRQLFFLLLVFMGVKLVFFN